MSASSLAVAARPSVLARVWPAFRLRHVWALLALATTFIPLSATPQPLTDIWSTLAAGRWMVEQGRLLVDDPFTSAPLATEQVNAQWLAQLAYYGLYRLGGVALLLAANAAVATLGFGLVLAAAWTSSGAPRVASASVVLTFPLLYSNLGARPQTLVYPLFGLVPLALLLWANLHGSYVLGLLLVGGTGVGAVWQARRWAAGRGSALLLGVGLLATFLNPYGPGLLAYVARIGANPAIQQYITEWAPTSLGLREGALLLLSIGALGAVLLASPLRPRPFEWLLLAAFGWLALSSVRGVVWWGLILPPILARLLAWRRLTPRRAPPRESLPLNLALAGLVLAAAAMALPWWKAGNPLLPPDSRALVAAENPLRVAAFLRATPVPGLVWNHQPWGGYLDWTVWPAVRPFTDGRVEIHPTQVWLDSFALAYPDAEWERLASAYGINTFVLSAASNGGLAEVLDQSPGWRRAYADGQATVFVRERRDTAP